MWRCSSSTRVRPEPVGGEPDLDFTGPVGVGLDLPTDRSMSQLNTSRWGGSKASTRAHRHSLPSTPTSTIDPPTRGSNTMADSSACRMWWSGGHQLAMSSVNTVNARSTGASTTIDVRTGVWTDFRHSTLLGWTRPGS